MARFLIVDAHSIIFAWPELRQLHAQRMILARDALIQRLSAYHDFSDSRVVIVFDGQGSRAKDETLPGGVQVIYSATGQTADSVIERLVAAYASQHDITVATGDHLEQQTAITFGASAISPEHLRSLIEETEQDLQKAIKKHRRGR